MLLRNALVGIVLVLAPAAIAQTPFPAGEEGVVYYCTRIDKVPAADGGPLAVDLDGFLDEAVWKRAPFHGYTEYWKGGQLPVDEDDCDPKWAAVADDKYLYIAWRIADADIWKDQSTGCASFNDDAIELYFDGLADGVTCGSCPYNLDDAQLLIGASNIGKDDPALLEVGWVRAGGCIFAGPPVEDATGEPIIAGVVTDLEDPDGRVGWQGEIAIALETMTNGSWSVNPAHGTTIGWDVHIDDDDTGEGQGATTSALIWSKRDPNSQAWQNPGVWGKLTFVAPGKPLIEAARDISDDIRNGTSGPVTITVKPVEGLGTGHAVVQEELPPGLTPSRPSAGGVLAGNKITWDLGQLTSPATVSYTLAAAPDAVDQSLPGVALIDGEPVPIGGDTRYTGGPISPEGFIKLWDHLGPLAFKKPAIAGDNGPFGSCDANGGGDMALDWLVDADGALPEAEIQPFPGLLTKPDYGGTGRPGDGARAAGLVVGEGDTGAVVDNQYPRWHAATSRDDTIRHEDPGVNGINADDHVTHSSVYVTNTTGAPINTTIGFASDDSIQILLDGVDVTQGGVIACRGYGQAREEQNTAPVTLPPGESHILVKVADGGGQSGFRLRFQDPSGDPLLPGLLPPKISLALESAQSPPPRVTRSLSKSSFGPGESIAVTLSADIPGAGSLLHVFESVPRGAISDISLGGSLADGVITWSLNGVTKQDITYTVTPLDCSVGLAWGESTFATGPIEALVRGESAASATPVESDDLGAWTTTDISYSGGAAKRLGEHDLIVHGDGEQVGVTSDVCTFTHLKASGDFEIAARIDCFDDISHVGQGGIMVRDTLEGGSAGVFFYATSVPFAAGSAGTLRALSRSSAQKLALQINFQNRDIPSLPVWLRIRRVGTKLFFERSADGVDYGQPVATKDIGITSQQVNLGNDTLIGFSVAGGVAAAGAPSGPARYTFGGVNGTANGAPLPAFGGVPPGPIFHRGDSDDNGKLELTDAIRILGFLFLGSQAPVCLEAADADNNGELQLTDAVRILGYLFLGQAAPETPGPPPDNACGPDPAGTGDLGCASYASC